MFQTRITDNGSVDLTHDEANTAREALGALRLPPTAAIAVERLENGRPIAYCLTTVAEVLAWRPELSAIPRPSAGLDAVLPDVARQASNG